MSRWTSYIFFTACLALATGPLIQAQSSPANAGAAQTASASGAQPSAEKSTKTGFPFDDFKEFSAIMVGSVQFGDDREGHIYRSGDMLRTEGAEGYGYYIMNLKDQLTFGLSAAGCMRDKHLYFRAFPLSAGKPGRKFDRVDAGTETLDGHLCHVEDVTVSSGDLAKPIKLRFWLSDDQHGFPIRVQVTLPNGKTGSTIGFKNIVLGPPDPTLFIYQNSCKGELPQLPGKSPSATPGKTPHATAPTDGLPK